MGVLVHFVNGANAILGGDSTMGQVKSMSVPELSWKMGTIDAAGLPGEIEVPMGIEKLTAKLVFTSIYPDAAAKLSMPNRAASLQFRANLQSIDGEGIDGEVPFVCRMLVLPRKLMLGELKPRENTEQEVELSPLSLDVEMGGKPYLKYSPLDGILEIGGEDVYATRRRNLGVK
ncbi:MAG: phage major tail tube protein [Candidatus Methylomirabilis sp.]|nr:phage major tail tube protein [Deltaproteobacteria bacterium]